MEDYKEKIRNLYNKVRFSALLADSYVAKKLEEAFPELKEESEDERIRKFLHHTFTAQYLCKDKLGKWHGEPVTNILAWLEKQAEQKPAVIIPKFRVGDTIVEKEPNGSCHPVVIKYIGEGYYACSSSDDRRHLTFPIKQEDEYKLVEQKPTQSPKAMTKLEEKLSSLVVAAVHTYCEKNLLDTPHFVGLILGDKMAKEWSKEILTLAEEELRKMRQKPADSYCKENCKGYQETGRCFADGDCQAKREAEQNPVWSEEDDTFFKAIIRDIENIQYISENAKKDRISWLKSLKNRVQPLPKQEWSEEDEEMRNFVTNIFKRFST